MVSSEPGDRRVPVRARPQPGEGLDLRADLRRGVDQEPGLAVGADGDRLLRARARAAARRAGASRQLAQPQFHCGKPPPAAEPRTRIFTTAALVCGRTSASVTIGFARPRSAATGSRGSRSREVALIATDFRAHVDLDEGRGFPLHGYVLSEARLGAASQLFCPSAPESQAAWGNAARRPPVVPGGQQRIAGVAEAVNPLAMESTAPRAPPGTGSKRCRTGPASVALRVEDGDASVRMFGHERLGDAARDRHERLRPARPRSKTRIVAGTVASWDRSKRRPLPRHRCRSAAPSSPRPPARIAARSTFHLCSAGHQLRADRHAPARVDEHHRRRFDRRPAAGDGRRLGQRSCRSSPAPSAWSMPSPTRRATSTRTGSRPPAARSAPRRRNRARARSERADQVPPGWSMVCLVSAPSAPS